MGRSFNWVIVLLVILLGVVSLAVIQSVAQDFFVSQFIFFILGFVLLFLVARIDHRVLAAFHGYGWGLSVAALLLTFVFGRVTRQTIRWVTVAGLSFQPSELVKPLIIISLASFFANKKPTWQNLARSLFLIGVPAGLVFLQPNLGSALLYLFIWLTGLFFWVNTKKMVSVLLIFAFVGFIGWHQLRDYQQNRLRSFFAPSSDPMGDGYHLIQAKIAAGSGQLFGRGLFRGTQSHLYFLPERHSDFIFASLAEELGFVGAGAVVLIYFFLLAQILRVAFRVKQFYGSLVCLGVFAVFFSQIVINIGMNVGLMPITGITLPLISTGGSSILSLMVCLGLVESVAQQEKGESFS